MTCQQVRECSKAVRTGTTQDRLAKMSRHGREHSSATATIVEIRGLQAVAAITLQTLPIKVPHPSAKSA